MASYTSARISDDPQAEIKQSPAASSTTAPRHILSESKKQNNCASFIIDNCVRLNSNDRITLFKAQKALKTETCNKSSQISSHGSSVSPLTTTAAAASSAATGAATGAATAARSKARGFPAGRYNSPTDSLISPISKGLLRRGKTKAPYYYTKPPHKSLDVSLVPPKVLDNAFDI